MKLPLATLPIKEVYRAYPDAEAFFLSLGIPAPALGMTIREYADSLDEEMLEDKGFDRDGLVDHFIAFMTRISGSVPAEGDRVESLTIVGGHDKAGLAENASLVLCRGDIVSLVGPTGSGKSRLLADIEWLAQGDTPTGRSVLINGKTVEPTWRYRSSQSLVAELSQHMNFVMDLTVAEFIEMHGRARMAPDVKGLVTEVVNGANVIAGEPFSGETRVTSLSGGQSRALMIVDIALVSHLPIVLVDEIENAGIDPAAALNLLMSEGKIVFIATHDPVLALMAKKRVVLKDGGIRKILATTESEHRNLSIMRRLSRILSSARDAIRNGERIEEPLGEPLTASLAGVWATSPGNWMPKDDAEARKDRKATEGEHRKTTV
ncbi:MAG: ATP-binding cassette domain-containing protein [Syntrophorhabdales bacterium]